MIGDVACLDGPGGRPLPGLATVAIQQAHHVAAAHPGREGAALQPFKYLDKGALAVVGHGKAVCEISGLKLWGRPAFLTYVGVHLFYLGGQLGRRFEVMLRWVGARFGERQSALIEGELASVERASPGRGDDRVGAHLLPLAADLEAARSQMAFTLGFHIILASLGVAFPAIILIANYIGLRRNDQAALALAQRWSRWPRSCSRSARSRAPSCRSRWGCSGPSSCAASATSSARLRARGHLLLHRGDLHRDLHLRLEAPVGHGSTSGPASRS